MVIDYIGKQKKRFHHDCHEQHLKDQEFKEKEKEELNELYETIKDLCDVNIIPPSFMGLIQRLRNGDPLIGMRKNDKRQFKQGFPYPVIQKAYEIKSDLIQWKRGQWDGSTGRFLTFVLFYYITDIIEDTNEQWEEEKRQLAEQERNDHIIQGMIGEEWTFNNEENNHDISDLLD